MPQPVTGQRPHAAKRELPRQAWRNACVITTLPAEEWGLASIATSTLSRDAGCPQITNGEGGPSRPRLNGGEVPLRPPSRANPSVFLKPAEGPPALPILPLPPVGSLC